MSGFVRLVQRRERDSNPRNPLGVYTLSRRASSTTRASLQGLVETGCKGIDFFLIMQEFRLRIYIEMQCLDAITWLTRYLLGTELIQRDKTRIADVSLMR